MLRERKWIITKKSQNQYGLALDNRKDYTKLDWITWTATLTQNRDDFEALIDPIFTFLNATPDRAPMGDWYQNEEARKEGFTARPVVGGVFLRMLYDKSVWDKYAGHDQTKASNWAAIPKPPVITMIVPAADNLRQCGATPLPFRQTVGRRLISSIPPGHSAKADLERKVRRALLSARSGTPMTFGCAAKLRFLHEPMTSWRDGCIMMKTRRFTINGVLAVKAVDTLPV